MTTLKEVEAYLIERSKSQNVIKSVLKFVLPEGIIVIDGSSGAYVYHNNNVPNADCAIYIDIPTFNKIKNKKINPVFAYTFKKLKVVGDIKLALKVIGFI
ncbi:MAG: SCP2 sterol-binding domain-containing protein [Sphingobacteriales bacterium]|jgi:putative sterol carrier protein|nr:MAG: SCP2 sterol-binding domain-containing protein [Sphingobacteriales bacterium]